MIKHKTFIQIIYILLIASVICCSTSKKVVKADLSFRSVTFTSAYGAEEERVSKLLEEVKNTVVEYKKTDSISDKYYLQKDFVYAVSKRILRLNELGLYKLPHIYLHFGSDSIMEVHVSEKEYQKIKHFTQSNLLKENKKVTLELEIIEKDRGIYYSDNIISVKKIDGRSRSNI